MNENMTYAPLLAALGHEARLEIYRLLVRAGEPGLNVGEIGTHLQMPASTLSHHLSNLVHTGLVVQQKNGREVLNRVDFDIMNQTVSFLTDECCTGLGVASEDAA